MTDLHLLDPAPPTTGDDHVRRVVGRLQAHPVLVGGALGLGVGACVALFSWSALLLVMAGLAVAVVRRPFDAALIMLIAAPCLLPTVYIAGLTLDNYLTLAGILLVGLASLAAARLPFTALSVFPLAVGLAIGLAGLANAVPWTGGVLRFVGVATVPWLAMHCEGGPRFAVRVVKVVSAAVAFSVVIQPLTAYPAPFPFDDGGTGFRYGGLLGHPNFTAYSLAIVALAIIAQRRIAVRDGALLALMVTALLMTGSVAATGFFAVASLCVAARHLRRLLVGAVLGAVALVVAGDTLLGRVGAFAETGLGGENSATWRETQWEQALQLADGHWFTGIGWQETSRRLANGLEAHSAYVEVVVELGVLGALLVLVGLVYVAGRVRRSVLAVSILLYVLVTSISDPTIFYPACSTLMMVILAVTVAVADDNLTTARAPSAARPSMPALSTRERSR